MLEQSLWSEIEVFNLQNEPKAKLIACTLKVGGGFMSRGAREKETHNGDQIYLKIVS